MFTAPILPSRLAGLKELPGRLLIGKWGRNESVNGDFTVGTKTAKFLPVLQRAVGWDTVALDFEHNTVPGTEAYKADKEPRNVAAHAALQVVPGEGLYAVDIKWTPDGVKSVQSGLHPDLSPTIKKDDSGEVVLVHSAALCRAGAVTDLKVFSAMNLAELIGSEQFAAYSAALTSKPIPTMDYKKLLILLLGLDANASDADIEAGCSRFADSVKKIGTASGSLESFTVNLKSINERITAVEKAGQKTEREAIISEAIRAGKLIPNSATLEKIAENATLKAILDDLPADQVPLAKRTPEGLKAHSASIIGGSSNAAELEVARQMGVSEENLKKYGNRR